MSRLGRRAPAGRPPPPTATRGQLRVLIGSAAGVAALVGMVGALVVGPDRPRAGIALALAPFALAVLDLSVAVWATRVVRLTAAADRPEVLSGDEAGLCIGVVGPRLPVSLAFARFGTAPAAVVEAPGEGTVRAVMRGRGVLMSLTVTVSSTGLCGIVGLSRIHRVPLPGPLVIAPRPVPAAPLPDLAGRWGEGDAVTAPDGDLVRAVRPYLPGDRLRQVHWRASAKRGELVVKETDQVLGPVLHLVVDLGDGGAASEEAAGRAAWYAREALGRGHHLVLTTYDDGYTVTAPADSVREVNRRLARALLGRAEVADLPTGVAHLLVVSDQGDRWV